ncbi:MAG: O-antigen ligase family protein [Clostridiales bacterium]|nr:O-antigen ligase family protein [Clostridiales bacterium]
MREKNHNTIGAVLLVLVMCLVPLVVSAYKYETDLQQYAWASNTAVRYDFFLFWKGQLLLLLCALMAFYVAIKGLLVRQGMPDCKIEKKYMIPLVLYWILALEATIFSKHTETAVRGGYEQWEGMLILSAYVLVLFFAYWMLRGKWELKIVAYGLLAGVFVMALLGSMQAFGYDFFRTDMGKNVMNFMLDQKLDFNFNFETGRVYASLYNPNYVGSYVALLLPVILSLISLKTKPVSLFVSLMSGITSALLLVMLFGSQSLTGCIGVMASLILFLILMIPKMKKRPLPFVLGGVLCVVACVILVFNYRSLFEYGINKMFHPAPNNQVIRSMEGKDGTLKMTMDNGDVLNLKVNIAEGEYRYEATDEKGNSYNLYEDETAERMKFSDKKYQTIEIEEKKIESKNQTYNGFIIYTPSTGRSYTIAMQGEKYEEAGVNQTEYRIVTPFYKLDELRHIETFGFEDNLHFGSRRGFIWSRTLPLLKKYIFQGAGPNTFIYTFPNDDYVGLTNVGYAGSLVTKPHNMFLQIAIQTGGISLLAFLALYVIYLWEGFRLYFRKTSYSSMEIFGIGIMLGTFGYLVTGLANDSTVAVAPVYWCLLGVGMAVNRYNRRNSQIGERE